MKLLEATRYDKVSGIYVIECLINHRVYVGSTTNLYARIGMHIRDLNKRTKFAQKNLLEDWNQFGAENFEATVLEEVDNDCPIQEIEKKEELWISKYENVYNINRFPSKRIPWNKGMTLAEMFKYSSTNGKPI
jgi:group I intron endonuclease